MITRRELFGTAIGTGLAVRSLTAAKTPRKVIVAGGGIAGLCCAYELHRLGHDVTVLEAAPQVGGHVKTLREGFADGLYVDAGAEQFTRPGYEVYWSYVKEFNLPYIQDRRRNSMLRRIDDKVYSEEDLANPRVLNAFGFNTREIQYLQKNPWWDLPRLYLDKYTDAFQDEYRPFDAGLNHLDKITTTQLLQNDGASAAGVRFAGGNSSALHTTWHAAILRRRGVPLWPTEVFRLKGGNTLLPETFAAKLGDRVKVDCPVTGIRHGATGVTVDYRNGGQQKQIQGDFLVCCMSAVMLRQLPISPALPDSKRWAVENIRYYSATRPIIQSKNKFWRDEKVSINIEFSKPSLVHVWSMADDVPSDRGLIVGTAEPGQPSQHALETFRSFYPGKRDTIEKVTTHDWSKDPWSTACETTSFTPGEITRFWPALIEPHGRIHFAGAYCDNLNWGQEAATRSAHRVATAIHKV